MIHAAGIDSPGLAGSPAIAAEVVRLLTCAGLVLRPNPSFDGRRYPLVMPKKRVKGITYGPNGNKLVQDADMEGKVIGGESCVLMPITMMIAKSYFALYRNHLFHELRQFVYIKQHRQINHPFIQ